MSCSWITCTHDDTGSVRRHLNSIFSLYLNCFHGRETPFSPTSVLYSFFISILYLSYNHVTTYDVSVLCIVHTPNPHTSHTNPLFTNVKSLATGSVLPLCTRLRTFSISLRPVYLHVSFSQDRLPCQWRFGIRVHTSHVNTLCFSGYPDRVSLVSPPNVLDGVSPSSLHPTVLQGLQSPTQTTFILGFFGGTQILTKRYDPYKYVTVGTYDAGQWDNETYRHTPVGSVAEPHSLR